MKALQSSSLRASPLNPLRTPSNRKSHQITNARLTRRRSFISASASVSAPKRDSGYPRTRSCCPLGRRLLKVLVLVCLLLGLSVVATSIGLRLVSLIWWCFLGVFWLRLHSPLRRSWSIVLVTCVVSPDSCCFIFIFDGYCFVVSSVSWRRLLERFWFEQGTSLQVQGFWFSSCGFSQVSLQLYASFRLLLVLMKVDICASFMVALIM
ncbi:hypothetical protein HID58_080919 [Brassica napus]|uniref:Transmembrane protein n=1 Tax=Brassica napus TaxID=3708 RepID=A0ABQ7Y686_BRANA|nr:hypothetical protein HID58_080919 [Brassica napus]